MTNEIDSEGMIYIWSDISSGYWKQQSNQLCQYTIAETRKWNAQWNLPNETRAQSEYKDRLSQVWGFPC